MRDHSALGKENIIPKPVLAELAGIGGKSKSAIERKLRAAVSKEVRKTGALIVSDHGGGGFYIAVNREELLAFKKSLTNLGAGTFRRLAAVNAELKRLDRIDADQIALFDTQASEDAVGGENGCVTE